ncbi:MAG: TolC family protein [Rhodothermaceae bacterium]|nr:TolC family protein [Rhodothermaceae bacterium]MYD57953.1 TolC family protein [Rhodothermaceae bacterium]MYI44122.1 TolC family protein [Rhodothermaceae bacterium]
MKLIQFAGVTCVSLLLLLLLSPIQVRGQDPSDTPADSLLRLGDLLAEVRTHNPLLQASNLEAKALATRSAQISALPDPSVTIAYRPVPILTARGTIRSQWSIEQEIPYPGKLGLQGSIADLTAEIKRFATADLEEALLLQVKQSYIELYRIQQQELRILAFTDRLRNFEEAAATRYEVGAGVQQAILKTQLEKNSLSRLQLELSIERRTATEALARLLNRPVSAESRVAVTVEAPSHVEFDAIDLLEVALSQRPEINALGTAAKRADKEIELARKQFKPNLRFGITYFDVGRADVPPTASGRDALGINATISIPLQRNRLRAQLEEARVRRSHVHVRQEAITTSIATQVADLMHQLRGEARQLELFEEALIPQAETALQATLNSYATGRTDFLDLLDSERTLFSLGMSFDNTLARYLRAAAALERALGVDSLADLINY